MKINFPKIISQKRLTNFIELLLLFLSSNLFSQQAFASDGNAIGAIVEVIWYVFLLGEGLLLVIVASIVVLVRKSKDRVISQSFILSIAGIACGGAAFYWLKAGFSYTWPFILGMCSCLSLLVWLLRRNVKS